MASIQGVYVALFGRPADPLGLAFFNQATNNGANLTAVGDLASTPEYQNRFAGQTNTQIINSIYKSLFNRDADLAGLTFFANALANKTLNINNIAIAIFDGAQGSDITIRDLKVAAANSFTTALDTAPEVLGYQGTAAANAGVAFLTGVTTTAPTAAQVDAAVATAVAAGSGGAGTPGLNFTLTVGADSLSPNSAVAATKTTAGDDLFRGITANSLETTDSIDGGAGVDTLRASLTGADAAAGGTTAVSIQPILTSVEKVFLDIDTTVGVGAGATDGVVYTFNAGDSKGITELWSEGSSITEVGGSVSSITFAGVNLATTVGVKDSGASLTVNFAGATGAADTATIALADSTGGTVTVGAIENLKVLSTAGGVAATTVNTMTFAAAQAETMSLTGDQAATITAGGAGGVLKSFDASTFTKALTLNLSTGPSAVEVKGGSGADTYNITDDANDKVTIDLGAGADTLNIRTNAFHTITTGAGADTLNIALDGNHKALDISTAAALAASVITVTDFTSGSDVLKLDAAVGGAKITLSGTQLSTISGSSNLLTATQAAFTAAAAAKGAALADGDGFAFQFGGDTYVVVDGATADDDAVAAGNQFLLSTDDYIVKLTGVTSLAAADLSIV